MSSEDCEASVVEADNSPPQLLRWTVKKSGATTPPTSDDYTQWTVEQLRKECTSRKIRVNRKTPAEERIKQLVAFGEYQLSLIAEVVESAPASKSTPGPRSKHCCARVLTMLFSDAYATRFAETGGRVTRQQLDAGETHANSVFWRDFTLDFNSNRTDFNRLHSASARLTELDPSVIVTRTSVELYDIWRAVLSKYQRALANFTKSGEHGDDFFTYCSGSLDALYLQGCLELKHDLTSFVEGGMLPEDQFDSLKRGSGRITDLQSPSSKKMKMEMISTIQGISAKILDNSSATVDSILKMHKLIEHVDNRLEALMTKCIFDAALERNANAYREKLLAMDAALCKET